MVVKLVHLASDFYYVVVNVMFRLLDYAQTKEKYMEMIYMSKRDTTKLAEKIIKDANKYSIPLKKKPKPKK